MSNNNTTTNDARIGTPLAFHIRRLRQWYEAAGLSQAELAELAGISYWVLQEYETRRALPRTVEVVLSLALALEVPFEELIDPLRVKQLRAAIAKRRRDDNRVRQTRRRRVYAT